MAKPELIMESRPKDDFLTGVCSACPNVRFIRAGNSLPQTALLRGMFGAHVQGSTGPKPRTLRNDHRQGRTSVGGSGLHLSTERQNVGTTFGNLRFVGTTAQYYCPLFRHLVVARYAVTRSPTVGIASFGWVETTTRFGILETVRNGSKHLSPRVSNLEQTADAQLTKVLVGG